MKPIKKHNIKKPTDKGFLDICRGNKDTDQGHLTNLTSNLTLQSVRPIM